MSMKYLHSKTFYLIIVLGVLLSFSAFQKFTTQEPHEPGNTPPQQTGKNNTTNRDQAIQRVLSQPKSDKLQRAQINGTIYLLTGYDQARNRENKPGWKDGGILIFK